MKKTEILRRQVVLLAIVFMALNFYLADSYFGFHLSASKTLSRLPASLAFGQTALAGTPGKVITKLAFDCRTLGKPYQQAISTKWLQISFTHCSSQDDLHVKNTTNGSEANLFRTQDGVISDIITLTKGDNQIAIKHGSAFENISITLQ